MTVCAAAVSGAAVKVGNAGARERQPWNEESAGHSTPNGMSFAHTAGPLLLRGNRWVGNATMLAIFDCGALIAAERRVCYTRSA
jgi:hypothetical protein